MRPLRCSSRAGFQGRSTWMRSWQRICRLMPSRAASVQIRMRSGSSAGSELNRRFSSSRRSVERRASEGRDAVVGRRSSSASASRTSSQRRVSSYSVKRTSRRSFHRPSGGHVAANPRGEQVERARPARWACLRASASISSTSARLATLAASAPAASAASISSACDEALARRLVVGLVLRLGSALDEASAAAGDAAAFGLREAPCDAPPASWRKRRSRTAGAVEGRRTTAAQSPASRGGSSPTSRADGLAIVQRACATAEVPAHRSAGP